MKAFDAYFHGTYAAARPFVLLRVLLSMLALDAWMLMIGHAGRYGAGDFNVAHFAVIDALGPLPTPGLYIGVLLLSGLLALVVALSGAGLGPRLLLLSLYTYSWAMSMLDSYQHHYFVSLLLLCIAFFPGVPAATWGPVAARAALPTVRGFGYPLLCATIAILYVYTALAKCDGNWVSGATIQRISTGGAVLTGLRRVATALGMDGDRFWSLVATSVIPHELFIAVGYALAPLRDRARRPLIGHLCTLAGLAALLLHLGAEGMGLEIGWFSYYMMALAVLVLLPASVVQPLARGLAWPAHLLAEEATATPPRTALLMALASAVVLHISAHMLDLPGAGGMAWAGSGLLLVYVALRARRGAGHGALPVVLATGVSAAVMWLAIAQSDVRWDYYRYRGGDLMRRGELREALETYRRGERYAGPRACDADAQCARAGGRCVDGYCVDSGGRRVRDTRKHKIEQLRRRLGQ